MLLRARRAPVGGQLCKRHGPSLGWWENGRPETVEAYADGKMTEAKTWDRDGTLVADDRQLPRQPSIPPTSMLWVKFGQRSSIPNVKR